MALVRSHFLILNGEMNDREARANLFVHKQDLESEWVDGNWADISQSHLMRMLVRVIVVSMQHLLLNGGGLGGAGALLGDS